MSRCGRSGRRPHEQDFCRCRQLFWTHMSLHEFIHKHFSRAMILIFQAPHLPLAARHAVLTNFDLLCCQYCRCLQPSFPSSRSHFVRPSLPASIQVICSNMFHPYPSSSHVLATSSPKPVIEQGLLDAPLLRILVT